MPLQPWRRSRSRDCKRARTGGGGKLPTGRFSVIYRFSHGEKAMVAPARECAWCQSRKGRSCFRWRFPDLSLHFPAFEVCPLFHCPSVATRHLPESCPQGASKSKKKWKEGGGQPVRPAPALPVPARPCLSCYLSPLL